MTVQRSGPAPASSTAGVPITDLFAVGEDGVTLAVPSRSDTAADGALAEFLVGHAEDRAVADVGVFGQPGLNLGR